MSSFVRDLVYALAGLKHLFLFQDGWRGCFDVSYEGVARSFRAAIPTLPLYALIQLGIVYMIQAAGQSHPGFPPAYLAADFARIWLVFPVSAALAATLFSRKGAYGLWLAVHNWTVFTLIAFQAVLVVIYLAGLMPPEALWFFLAIPMRFILLIVHWRVATATLGLSWGAGAGAAALHIVIDLIAATAIAYALAG